MIEFFRSWCEEIIVAVVISLIIESIMPEGSYKKYIKVVIGVYIIFTILNPFLGKLDIKDFELSQKINWETDETSTIPTENVRAMYVSGIQETLKEAIQQEFGYSVKDVQIDYDENYENIENIYLSIQEKNTVNEIAKVEIGNETVQNENSYQEVKKYIAENYDVDNSQIVIR